MKLSRKSLMYFVVLSAAVLILTGCPKDSNDSVEQLSPDDLNTAVRGDEVITGQPTTKTWGDGGIDSRPSTGEIAKTGGNELLVVYFDFDKYNLRPDTIEILRGNIQFLKKNSTTRIIIEGHCDERGTNEYNMALGSRRANSCRQYLLANGIAASRITITSYGEERAVDPGHNETAWAKNRRAEFIVISR